MLFLNPFLQHEMKIAIYIGKGDVDNDPGIVRLMEELRIGGHELYVLADKVLLDEADMLLSVGGDGTFLSASMLVAGRGIPVVGVNSGRLGFLSENRPADVVQALLSGEYSVEHRAMLEAEVHTGESSIDSWPYALNEFTVHRSGAAMLGVEVSVDGVQLPVYWADGLIVSTSSGSTAYSLSVGGPIVLPESRVLIISPIAPHNLNVRPLVVPDTAEVRLKMHSRDENVIFTADNRTASISSDSQIAVRVAQFSLERVRLNRSNFIDALTEKLFWGEDVRNIK
jgi:NAD+ kinase